MRNWFLLLLLCFCACSDNPYLIEQDKLVRMVAEKQVAFAHITKLKVHKLDKDSIRSKSLNSIIEAHGETWERFDSTMNFYYQNIKLYSEFLQLVDGALKEMEQQLIESDSSLVKKSR